MSNFHEPKFKVGQKVRVLPVEVGYYEYDSFEDSMLDYVGKEFEIAELELYNTTCLYYLKDVHVYDTPVYGKYRFQEDWLEGV